MDFLGRLHRLQYEDEGLWVAQYRHADSSRTELHIQGDREQPSAQHLENAAKVMGSFEEYKSHAWGFLRAFIPSASERDFCLLWVESRCIHIDGDPWEDGVIFAWSKDHNGTSWKYNVKFWIHVDLAGYSPDHYAVAMEVTIA